VTVRKDDEPEGTITIPVGWVEYIDTGLELMCDPVADDVRRGLRMRLARVPLLALPHVPEKGAMSEDQTGTQAAGAGEAQKQEVAAGVDQTPADADDVRVVGEVELGPVSIDMRNCLVCQRNRRRRFVQKDGVAREDQRCLSCISRGVK
jgi:hypothetical protein